MTYSSNIFSRIPVILTITLGLGMGLPAFGAGPSQSELDFAGTPTDSCLMTNKSYDGHRYVGIAPAFVEICSAGITG